MHFRTGFPGVDAAPATAVLSLEFVARPENARSAPLFLPGDIQTGLGDVPGFAGSLVLVADHEPRLITVVIFWNGSDGQQNCSHSIRRVRALLAPYLDRSLRLQTMMAHVPEPRGMSPETNSGETGFILRENSIQEAVCAA